MALEQIETGQDLWDVPRYPATTMVWYEDWTDWWASGYDIDSRYGLQFARIEYKGAFSVYDVIAFYEAQMPGYGWQMGSKAFIDEDVIGIGFWKEAEHGGIPYYTDVVRIVAREEENGIGYIEVFYTPVDVPTVPGTALIMWESMWPFGGYLDMEYKGSVIPQEGISYFMQAMSKLQWEATYYDEYYPWSVEAEFEKPVIGPNGPGLMVVEVYAYFPQGLPWYVEQPVIIEIERYWD
jgi:hypothetical protein